MPATQEFKDEIKQSLGGECLVDVELTDSDYELCFKKAKRIYRQQSPNNYRRYFAAIDVQRDTREYVLPQETDEVVMVIRPSNGFLSGDEFLTQNMYDQFFNQFGVSTGTCGCGGGMTRFDLLSYELVMQRIDMMSKYSNDDIEFHYDKFTKTLTFLGTPKRNDTYFVEVYNNLTDEEYCEIDWIVRWAIAEAKEILGRAYSKFQSLPSPTGETNLGGAELIQDSKTEKEELKEEILELVSGDIDAYYISMG